MHQTKHKVHFSNELIVAGLESKLLGSSNSHFCLYFLCLFFLKLPGAEIETIKPAENINNTNQTIHKQI